MSLKYFNVTAWSKGVRKLIDSFDCNPVDLGSNPDSERFFSGKEGLTDSVKGKGGRVEPSSAASKLIKRFREH